MFCKYCGSKLLDDAAFCHECGKATCEQNAQPVYQQPAPPVQPVYQQPAPVVPPVQPVYQQPAPAPQPVQPVYQQPAPPVQPVQPVYQQPAPPVQPVQPQQPVYQPPVYQPPVYQPPVAPQYTYTIPAQPVQQSVVQPVQQSYSEADQLAELQQQTLTFGVLGICLSILGLPGFILSVIAANKAKAYKKLTGKVDGKVLVGWRLSKAGRAIGVVMTIALYLLITALRNGATFNFDFDSVLPDHFSGGGEF